MINKLLIILLVIILLYAIREEIRDIRHRLKDKTINEEDVYSITRNLVNWRRALLTTLIILILNLLLENFEIDRKKIILFFLICFTVIYFQFSFYDYHVYKPYLNMFDCKLKV